MRATTRGRRLRSTPRPRDRRDQLAAIAADLFRRNGYHNVGVNDIAAAAGITGPAVYRHFPSKQAILGHVVLSGLDRFAAVIAAASEGSAAASRDASADGATDPAGRLDAVAASVAGLVVERRDLGALWRREGRNLPAEDRAALQQRARHATRFGVRLLRDVRPELPEADADLLCWAALSVYGSVSEHQVSLPRARFERLLAGLALAAVRCELPGAVAGAVAVDVPGAVAVEVASVDARGAGGSAADGAGVPPAHRREQLLELAARMFCEHGFHGVTMEDIGAAAGISGPSIYRHYAGKADLLLAMCARIGEHLRPGVRAAATEGLPALIDSFVGTVLAHRDLVAAYLLEGHNLPDRDRAELHRLQRAYLAEWVTRLVAAGPEPDERAARVRVHAAFAVINDLARTHRFAARPTLAADLTALARAVLTGGPA